MILSDADIRKRLAEGTLTIDPLADPAVQIQPASVDLRLGNRFLEFQRTNIPCIHPDEATEVDDYVDETVVDDDEDFVLHPGDFVLGTTVERVGIPDDLVAHVEGRSSLGRLAIVVHASLPADEEVLLWTPTDGLGFYEIGDIVTNERPARAVAFDPTTLRVSTHKVTDYITNPTQRIYRVRLDSGREVRVTKDHNLFTIDTRGGVVRIPSEDATGRLVMVPDTVPESPTPIEAIDVHRRQVATLGSNVASDGGLTIDRSSPIGRLEPADSGRSVPDRRGALTESGNERTRPKANAPSLTPAFGWLLGAYIAGGETTAETVRLPDDDTIRDHLSALGLSDHLSDTNPGDEILIRAPTWAAVFRGLAGSASDQTIPPRALNWPAPVLTELLNGLLAVRGTHRGGQDRLTVESRKLASQIGYLGTRLGYRTELDRPGTGTPTAGWTVRLLPDARAAARPIPVPAALLLACRTQAGLDRREAATAIGLATAALGAMERGSREAVSHRTLAQLRDTYADAGADTTRLDHLLDGGVRFERVAAVTATDRVEPTYDLEVQPNGRTIENFIGGHGGVFLSNTAGLCDPGYEGQITLELSNLGAAPVALSPGMRVSQLTFTQLSSSAERPYGADRGSKYQGQDGPQASRLGGDPEFEDDT